MAAPSQPMQMIETYSADAVRCWAASTSLGKDAIISEDKIQAGAKLATKLWNVARFAGRFLGDQGSGIGDREIGRLGDWGLEIEDLTLADRWVLGRTQLLVERTTKLFEQFDYATAKSEAETFFWRVLADNYLEMAKLRLYEGGEAAKGAQFALGTALLTMLKLFAPIMPFITERIYQGLFDANGSIHRSAWPSLDEALLDNTAVSQGDTLVEIATAVRRLKSEHNLGLGTEIAALIFDESATFLQAAATDLQSITRAKEIRFNGETANGIELLSGLRMAVEIG